MSSCLEVKHHIGQTISKIRKEKGLTLTQLAQKSNLSKSYLSNIERALNKNPSIKVMKKVAEGLEVNFDQLMISPTVHQNPELEWLTFIKELKGLGIKKEQLHEYKAIIEFAKWQNEISEGNSNE
jgi:XRE family transcriptional regulator of biofilm formation